MSRIVPHYRPELEDGSIRAGKPVSALDWSTLAAAANWCQGHGGMLVPWTAIGLTVATSTTRTFPFRVQPKITCVQRVWRVNLRADTAGASATITPTGGSALTVYPSTARDGRSDSYEVLHELTAKSATKAEISVAIAASGGGIVVESIACYEQTRRVLAADTTDYGVDLTTLRVRTPITDLANKQIAGVADAYQNLDARRSSQFHWSTATNSAITPGSTSYTNLFALDPVVQAAVVGTGTTTGTLRCEVYAKVSGGTGNVRCTAGQAGGNVVLAVTGTSFAWVGSGLAIESEDLTAADGRRTGWESVAVEAQDPSAQTLSVAAVSLFVTTTPV